MVGKGVQFDDATWQALTILARDRMMSFQEMPMKLLQISCAKLDRAVDLKDALKRSAKHGAPEDVDKPAGRAARGRHH